MTPPAWTSLCEPLPPTGRGAFVDDGRGGLLLFLERGPLLRWTGSKLSAIDERPFGEGEWVDCFFGCFDPGAGDMLLFGARQDELLFRRAGGGDVRRIAVEDVQSYQGCAAAIVPPGHGEPWVLLPGEPARTFALRGERLVELSRSDNFMSVAWDAAARRWMGVTVMGEVHAFDGRAWSRVGKGKQHGQIAWHPRLGAVVQLLADGPDAMRLTRWGGRAWIPVEPAARLPKFRSGFALGVDAVRDQVVMYGGQDFDKAGDLTNECFVSAAGKSFQSTLSRAYLPVGRYNTPCALPDGALAVVNHSALTVARFHGDRWEVRPLREGDGYAPGYDDRGLNFAASPGGIWALGSEGALRFARWGEPLVVVAPARGGPGTRYSGRVAMAWDAMRGRLVLFGGERRNDTWIFEGGAWRELQGGPRPRAGTGGMCATPAGIYLITGNQLWRLDGEVWQKVGEDLEWSARTLYHDTRRNRLWSIANGKVATFEGGRFRVVAGLPEDLSVPSHTYNASDTVGIDGPRDQLLAFSEAGVFSLSLAACGVGAGDLPTASIGEVVARPPPPELIRPAAGLERGTPSAAALTGVDVDARYRLLAVLPADPRALPLRSGGLAVYYDDEGEVEWDLGGSSTRVVLLPQGSRPPALVFDPEQDDLVAFTAVSFDEVDPEREEEFDTLSGRAFDLSRDSKIGGYPRFIQDEIQGACPTCGAALRFAAQLSADTYHFGDVGRLYVFVCPEEHWAGAAVQCH